LARGGYVLTQADVDVYNTVLGNARRESNVGSIFTNHGEALRVGQRLKQPQLARTLAAIERGGTQAFYDGPIARKIVAASEAHGGILSKRDFQNYRVREYAPVHCSYRGYDIASAPPPSSGGTTLCEILNVVQPFGLAAYGWNSVASLHVLIEAERRAYLDRNTFLGDPDFVRNPLDRLLSTQHAAHIRDAIVPDRATPSKELSAPLALNEETNTTHYSIVDGFGNAVAVTYTINDAFGSGLIAGDTGFFLNNEMDDFTSKPGTPNLYGLVQGTANAIAPGKTPLSSMAPTIVTKNGTLRIVAGSPGGSRIITIMLGVLQNIIDYGMDVQAAVNAPRAHHQWLPDTVYLEPGALRPDAQQRLETMGYTFTLQDGWGAAEAIERDDSGLLLGGSDRRRPSGAALGY
jgi:gamma-glutamyltranspeptidase/glutathione hydrolase